MNFNGLNEFFEDKYELDEADEFARTAFDSDDDSMLGKYTGWAQAEDGTNIYVDPDIIYISQLPYDELDTGEFEGYDIPSGEREFLHDRNSKYLPEIITAMYKMIIKLNRK